jgi:hypothetical protein
MPNDTVEEMLKEFEIEEFGRKTYPFIVSMEFEHLKELLTALSARVREDERRQIMREAGAVFVEWNEEEVDQYNNPAAKKHRVEMSRMNEFSQGKEDV